MNNNTSPKMVGRELLTNARTNKSTAFTEQERDELGLRGLLPPQVESQSSHIQRALESLRRKAVDIEKYIYLMQLLEQNERLFNQLLVQHTEELLPLVYTPTVGQACKEFAHIFRQPRGLYICANDRGHVRTIVDNWPEENVDVVVITDGERILGLGDLGANGMGIPIGKLALYSALAGIPPSRCLPIMFDIGTNNEELRSDMLYLGLRQPRITGDDYDSLMEEALQALCARFPGALIQFEDFLTPTAYRLLNKYQRQLLSFNDDIQGTAAVALGGILSALKVNGKDLKSCRFLFVGAGSAGTGIADLLVCQYQSMGVSEADALQQIAFCDGKGLVTQGRSTLREHVKRFARDSVAMDLNEAVQTLKPDFLIGATGVGGIFTRPIIESMTSNQARPAIFALSNPTSQAECTAEDCYTWSKGQALFVSGSPFDPVTVDDQQLVPGQGNNAYVFPGLGLGAIAGQATVINNQMLLAASQSLADAVSQSELDQGTLYPSLTRIREVSIQIAKAVIESAKSTGATSTELPEDLDRLLQDYMFVSTY